MIRRNFLTNGTVAGQFLDGVKILKDPAQSPWPGQDGLSIYDVCVFWHHQAMMVMTPPGQTDRNAAHSGPSFLPWHRYFLLRLEGFLQDALGDADFRIPYWDWCADAELPDPTTSVIWDGSNLGQFVGLSWPVRLAMNPFTGGLERVDRTMERALGADGSLPRLTDVRDALRDHPVYDASPYNSSSSSGARNYIEGWVGPANLHNDVHVWVGRDMGWSSSPNDPVFFLHHCNVDRIWAAWQEKYPAAPYLPDMTAPDSLQFHRSGDALYSIFEETITPEDLLDYGPSYQYDTLADFTGP